MASTPSHTEEERVEEYPGGLDPDDVLEMLPTEDEFSYEED